MQLAHLAYSQWRHILSWLLISYHPTECQCRPEREDMFSSLLKLHEKTHSYVASEMVDQACYITRETSKPLKWREDICLVLQCFMQCKNHQQFGLMLHHSSFVIHHVSYHLVARSERSQFKQPVIMPYLILNVWRSFNCISIFKIYICKISNLKVCFICPVNSEQL